MITSVTVVMVFKLDQTDKRIINIIKEKKFVNHDQLKKLVVKNGITSNNSFEKKIRELENNKKIRVVQLLRISNATNPEKKSPVPRYTKYYTMTKSGYPEEYRRYMNKMALKNVDQYIDDLKKRYRKLSLKEKTELSASYIMITWAGIFDIIKYNIDIQPEKDIDSRLLSIYKTKLHEMYKIIRDNPDSEIIERYVDAKARPQVNLFTFQDLYEYFKINSMRVRK